ncbi:hypothetical protein ILUMI_24226 [Ignelater luminosus]|uniref:Uncharacterized protein n=1 Tax=Ignelater luminosus TaxID=2038154 RepID=A0A8K0C9H9_IGNLU|nr:hypothetical protein ILUMI_24226 [Ignelater luminosus]
MQEISSIPLKISSFKQYFKKEYNIEIHVPRKDKCSLCACFENIPDSERTEKNRADFIKHQNDKDIAKQVFLAEQIRSSKDEFIVVSFDLQKVLATVHGPTGHTYMPVDSVHAVIENYSKSMNVQAPSEWSTIIRNARRRPKPYEIIQVYYPDILDWKSLSVPRKLQSVDVQYRRHRKLGFKKKARMERPNK